MRYLTRRKSPLLAVTDQRLRAETIPFFITRIFLARVQAHVTCPFLCFGYHRMSLDQTARTSHTSYNGRRNGTRPPPHLAAACASMIGCRACHLLANQFDNAGAEIRDQSPSGRCGRFRACRRRDLALDITENARFSYVAASPLNAVHECRGIIRRKAKTRVFHETCHRRRATTING